MSETMTLVSEGQRTVVGIELPKGKPQSPTRKVSFELANNEKFSPAGWIYADQLGSIAIGDYVSYRIEKNAEGFNKLTLLAPVTQGSGERDQMPAQDAPPASRGHDDAVGSGGSGPSPAAERDLRTGALVTDTEPSVPNTDLQRFEGWAFVANVGMVDLAYEELSDALEAGELDSITPELLKTVAQHLLNAADQAQRSLVGRTDRSANSHVRARAAVHTALRKHPVRGGLGLLVLDAWAAELTKTSSRLLAMAATL